MCILQLVKNTHRGKPSNETPAPAKSMKMDIWVVGSSNQQNFQKYKVVTVETPFIVIGPFCTPHSICLNIGFWQDSFVWK